MAPLGVLVTAQAMLVGSFDLLDAVKIALPPWLVWLVFAPVSLRFHRLWLFEGARPAQLRALARALPNAWSAGTGQLKKLT